MTEKLYKPLARFSLLNGIGRIICLITGVLLLGLPYEYWLSMSASSGANISQFTLAMWAILILHLLLAVIYLVPSMTEKYLRSGDSWARKIGSRLVAFLVPFLLGFDALLFLYRQDVELPGFLADVTPQQWIVALTIWIGPYWGLLVLPGAYLRELYVRHEVRKLRLPFKTGVKTLAGKAFFFPIGKVSKLLIGPFTAETGLPLWQKSKMPKFEVGMFLLALPLFPVFLAFAVGLNRGFFLPNMRLEGLSAFLPPYVAGFIFLLLLIRVIVSKKKIANGRAVLSAVVLPLFFAFGIWPVSSLRGVPVLYSFATHNGAVTEQTFIVLPQPDRLERMINGYCLNPLLVKPMVEPSTPVYLCGLSISRNDRVVTGSVFSLKGQETEYGFYHEREITRVEG